MRILDIYRVILPTFHINKEIVKLFLFNLCIFYHVFIV